MLELLLTVAKYDPSLEAKIAAGLPNKEKDAKK